MGLEMSNDAQDYLFLRLFQLGGLRDPVRFEYRLMLEEWGRDDNSIIIILINATPQKRIKA